MALREILANFGVTFDTGELEKGSASIDGVLGGLKGLAGNVAGAFAVGAIWHFVTAATESADAILKQSEALGISYVELKEWNFAASLTNVSADALSATLGRLSGGKFNAKGMKALGVDVKDASGQFKPATDLLEDVAEALFKIPDETERNHKAMAVLGRNYKTLLPLLSEGSKGLQEMRKEYHELGGGDSDKFAKDSVAFNENMVRLRLVFKLLAGTILGFVMPAFLTLSKAAIPFAKHISNIIKHSEALKAGFIALGAKGIIALSGKIGPLGTALKALAANFFTVILPLLILEDLLVFMAGGHSLFGKFIDDAFGPDSSAKVRKFVNDTVGDLKTFWKEQGTKKGAEDWALFRKTLNDDLAVPKWAKALGGVSDYLISWLNPLSLVKSLWDAIGAVPMGVWTTLSQILDVFIAWLNPLSAIDILWNKLGINMSTVAKEFVIGWENSIAIVSDAFVKLWNGILTGAAEPLKLVGKTLGALGATGTAASVQGVVAGIEGAKGVPDAYQTLQAQRSNSVANINAPTTINMVIPPGTPADVIKSVAVAAKQGAQQGGTALRDAKAAVTPGGG